MFNAWNEVTREELSKKVGCIMYEKFLGDLLCHVATWSSHVAKSNYHPSATSRRGFSTSRRHFNTPLPHRDVYCHVAMSNCKALCHVATWNSHVAT